MKKIFLRFGIVISLFLTVLAGGAQGAALTDYAENKIIDDILRSTTYTKPATIYVALLTVACSDSTGGTEVSGGSYARVAITKGDAAWKGTHGSATGASSGTNGTVTNAAAITFPAPTANWGQIVGFKIADNSAGGNDIVCASLSVPKTVNSGDAAPSFAVDALTVTIDN